MTRLQKIVLSLLLLFTAACYLNSLHVEFQLDDEKLREYRGMTNPDFLKQLHWLRAFMKGDRPLTTLTFSANHEMHGLAVEGYHIVNILIHILAVYLLYLFVRKLLAMPVMEGSFGNDRGWIAVVVAGVFALHPLQTGAVTYIIQRAEILASAFYLLSLLALIEFTEASGKRAFAFLTAAVGLFLMGWGSKEIVVTVPLMYMLFVVYFMGSGRLKKAALVLIPMILVGLTLGLAVVSSFKGSEDIGFGLKDVGLGPREYLYTEVRVLLTYLRLIFVPIHQNLDYAYPIYRHFFTANVFGPALLWLFLSGLSFSSLACGGKWKGHVRVMGFGFLWFLIMVLPTSSIIPLRDVIFEHRIYLAMAGIVLSAVVGIDMLLRMKGIRHTKMTASAAVLLCLILGGMTYARNDIWRDKVTLWQDVVKKSPRKARAHANLAFAYQQRGMFDKALMEDDIALGLIDDRSVTWGELIRNIGVIYYALGQTEKGIALYEEALLREPGNVEIMNNLAVGYIDAGSPDRALPYVELALKLRPSYDNAYNSLGEIYYYQGRCSEALAAFERAIALNPDETDRYWNVALALKCLGRRDEAQHYLKTYLMQVTDPQKRAAAEDLMREISLP